MMEVALYAGAVLVVTVSAITGRGDSPYLLFLIWLVPWAFLAWSRRRAAVYVAALALSCGALFVLERDGDHLGDLLTLVVGMGGLVGVGIVIRRVVDQLARSHADA